MPQEVGEYLPGRRPCGRALEEIDLCVAGLFCDATLEGRPGPDHARVIARADEAFGKCLRLALFIATQRAGEFGEVGEPVFDSLGEHGRGGCGCVVRRASGKRRRASSRQCGFPAAKWRLDSAEIGHYISGMRVAILSCGLLFFAAGFGALGDSPSDLHAADVAAYDSILARVDQGQTMISLGDMMVPVATVRLWRDQLAGTVQPSASQSGVNKWTGGNVYYAFNVNVSAAHQTAALDAMGEWAAFANLHFIARTSQTNYVLINDGGSGLSGGNSSVGMIGGAQNLNIGSTSWNRGTLTHELGHTLGLIHEHQRSDRDTFVTINFSNVPGGASDGNFILIPTSTNNGAYDFLSVMHYARKTLAVNPALDTITPKAGYTQFMDIMGNNADRVLSRGDRDGMAVVAMYGAPAVAPTIVVTNTKDSGTGALRTAIYKAFDIATDTPGATPVITFQIPNTDPNFAGGVFTIAPTDRMTAPGTGTTIDATTQTTFTGNTNASGPEVVLNGAQQTDVSTFGLGLRLSAANVTVKGLVINGFNTRGILITGATATGNTVAGCYIGTNAAGTAAVANAFAGIEISGGATGNTIGGTAVAARNVISGNTNQGVFVRDAGTIGNFIRGNWIGLNGAGTAALPNGFAGVELALGAGANTVGGGTAGAGNVISGNTYQGIYIAGTGGNTVAGNYIGTNAAGAAAVANGAAGIEMSGGAQTNVIGGTSAGARNIFSGNAYQGVILSGAGTSGNVVLGNYMGVNAAGTAALPNLSVGVGIFGGATNNTIGGTAAGAANVVSGNANQGVVVSGAGSSGNVVAGNFIGTNPAGSAAIPNAFFGVGIFGSATNNVIGGTSAGAGNLISGNTSDGIYIGDAGTNSNVVAGNFIGLNSAGTAAVKNGFAGVDISHGAQSNIIGGTVAAARNVISGNQNQGVSLNGSGTSSNSVMGNYIGTNPAGNAAIANGSPGVEISSSASANTIGGTAPGAGNVISGNAFRGATITGANNNTFAGNFIGLNATGTAALANKGAGIQIFGGAQGNTIGGTGGGRNFIAGNSGAGVTISGSPTNGNSIVGNSIGITPGGSVVANTSEGIAIFADGSGGAQNNVIGGIAPGAANLISGNGTSGVAIYNAGTTGNRISGNSITGNGGLGIDIWRDGVTPNDPGDGDTGPNNLQNFPVLTSAVLGFSTTVSGSLNSTASTTFRIEFFANSGGDASGYGEGQNFIGATSVTTNGSGDGSFATVLPATIPAGQKISATATDSVAGNTSEFAQNVTVTTTDTDGDGIPDAWMTAKFGHTTGQAGDKSRATDDADGDGMTNLQEFRAGTEPKQQASIFALPAPTHSGSDFLVGLPTLTGFTYRIEFTDTLAPTSWRPLADQIPGTGSTINITDPGAGTLAQRFYRALILP